MYNPSLMAVDKNQEFRRHQIDVHFNFSSENKSAGQTAKIGDSEYFYYVDGAEVQRSGAIETDRHTVMEVEGVEVLGLTSASPSAHRIPFELRFLAGRVTMPDIRVNELMAPSYLPTSANPTPFREGFVNTMFGQALLAGGPRWTPTIKIGPNSSLDIEFYFPLAARNGDATIGTDGIVRLYVVEARTDEKVRELLQHWGNVTGVPRLEGDNIIQDFTISDVESGETIEVQKRVPLDINNWEKLNGGPRCAAPFVSRWIGYCRPSAATTVNTWFTPETDNRKVVEKEQELAWNLPATEAIQINHMGIVPHSNLRWMRFTKPGRMVNPQIKVDSSYNFLAVPQLYDYSASQPTHGPSQLSPTYYLRGEKGSIDFRDTGTAVPAWASGTRGLDVAFWGNKFYLTEEIAAAADKAKSA